MALAGLVSPYLHVCAVCGKTRWVNNWERFGSQDVVDYALGDDVASVQQCLQSGCLGCEANPHLHGWVCKAPDFATPICYSLVHAAALEGSTHVLKYLLEQRASPSGPSSADIPTSPLLNACNFNFKMRQVRRASCIALLLEARADPSPTDSKGLGIRDWLCPHIAPQDADVCRQILTEAGVSLKTCLKLVAPERSEHQKEQAAATDGGDAETPYPKCGNSNCHKKRRRSEKPWRPQWCTWYCSDKCRYPPCSGRGCKKPRPQHNEYLFHRRPEWRCQACASKNKKV